MRKALLPLLLVAVSGACQAAPSINVLGAFFPAWMFSILGGVLAAVLVRLLIKRTATTLSIGDGALIYPALVALFALGIWLLCFQH